MKKLAINGGNPIIEHKMPARIAFGVKEQKMISKVINFYKAQNADPGYQGYFEEEYCKVFSNYLGGGYSDAVATGTIAVYIAIAALKLEKNSEVLCSPITDPGTISAITLNGLIPKLVDSEKNSYNTSILQILKRINSKTKAIVLVHSAGYSIDMKKIIKLAKSKKIKIIEDCSQAHGAEFNKKKVGTFGDVSAFSTMYRKASISGGCGGIVFTKNKEIYKNILAFSDRGKPRWKKKFDDRDPSKFLFPSLNFHTNEISCAIGISSIQRLEKTRLKRLNFVKRLSKLINSETKYCRSYGYDKHSSPFFFPVFVNDKKLKVSKKKFATALKAEGVDLNVQYKYVICEWPWVISYLADNYICKNAIDVVNHSFNIYLNENYGNREVNAIIKAIKKVEFFYKK